MSKVSWYRRIINAPAGNYDPLFEAIDWYSDQYDQAQNDVTLRKGMRLFEMESRIPGLTAYYYALLQELEAIHVWLELQHDQVLQKHRRHYIEHYARDLKDRQVEAYASAEGEVVAMKMLINELSLVRNKFMGIMKSLEYAHFQLGNLTKLRTAGMEDATI